MKNKTNCIKIKNKLELKIKKYLIKNKKSIIIHLKKEKDRIKKVTELEETGLHKTKKIKEKSNRKKRVKG